MPLDAQDPNAQKAQGLQQAPMLTASGSVQNATIESQGIDPVDRVSAALGKLTSDTGRALLKRKADAAYLEAYGNAGAGQAIGEMREQESAADEWFGGSATLAGAQARQIDNNVSGYMNYGIGLATTARSTDPAAFHKQVAAGAAAFLTGDERTDAILMARLTSDVPKITATHYKEHTQYVQEQVVLAQKQGIEVALQKVQAIGQLPAASRSDADLDSAVQELDALLAGTPDMGIAGVAALVDSAEVEMTRDKASLLTDRILLMGLEGKLPLTGAQVERLTNGKIKLAKSQVTGDAVERGAAIHKLHEYGDAGMGDLELQGKLTEYNEKYPDFPLTDDAIASILDRKKTADAGSQRDQEDLNDYLAGNNSNDRGRKLYHAMLMAQNPGEAGAKLVMGDVGKRAVSVPALVNEFETAFGVGPKLPTGDKNEGFAGPFLKFMTLARGYGDDVALLQLQNPTLKGIYGAGLELIREGSIDEATFVSNLSNPRRLRAKGDSVRSDPQAMEEVKDQVHKQVKSGAFRIMGLGWGNEAAEGYTASLTAQVERTVVNLMNTSGLTAYEAALSAARSLEQNYERIGNKPVYTGGQSLSSQMKLADKGASGTDVMDWFLKDNQKLGDNVQVHIHPGGVATVQRLDERGLHVGAGQEFSLEQIGKLYNNSVTLPKQADRDSYAAGMVAQVNAEAIAEKKKWAKVQRGVVLTDEQAMYEVNEEREINRLVLQKTVLPVINGAVARGSSLIDLAGQLWNGVKGVPSAANAQLNKVSQPIFGGIPAEVEKALIRGGQ